MIGFLPIYYLCYSGNFYNRNDAFTIDNLGFDSGNN